MKEKIKKIISHPLFPVFSSLGVLIAAVLLKEISFVAALILFIAALALVGWPVAVDAVRGILRRDLLDEKFLMCIASIGAMCIGEYTEAVAVMLF